MTLMQSVYLRAQSQGDKARASNAGRTLTINHNGKRYTATWNSREALWLLTDESCTEMSRFRALKVSQLRADVANWLNN